MGAGDSHAAAIEAALEETIGRDGLSFVNSGDVVYLKVNTNSGDFYPYSTNPDLVRMVGQWVLIGGQPRSSVTAPSGATRAP